MTIAQLNILLALAACLSPLLTLLKLWQVKEWRIDRLVEHLGREGLVSQLYGSVRPTILVLGIFALSLWDTARGVPVMLSVLGALTVVQIAAGRQRSPVWTQKALGIFALSAMIDLLLSVRLAGDFAVIALPYLQPAVVVVSWLIVKPLDAYLKYRVMNRATVLRQEFEGLIVIGITGSAGKTTTKELLAYVLRDERPLVTPAHVNTEMGVAQWMQRELGRRMHGRSDGKRTIMIVEMGAYRVGEIALLCEIVRPTIGVITAIGEQHLALFGSREAIVEAKGELFAALPKDGHAFVNSDNELAAGLLRRCVCPVTRVGTGGHTDVAATDIEETTEGIRLRTLDTTFSLPLHGTHNVTNVLLAIAVARSLGMVPGAIADALRSFQPLSGTFQVKTVSGITLLDDTYNSSPLSFSAAIEWSRFQPGKKKILVTSGIIELGEAEERIHAELAGSAQNIFAHVYLTDPRFLPYFRRVLGDRATMLPKQKASLASGDLLVCIGRMPQSIISRFLP